MMTRRELYQKWLNGTVTRNILGNYVRYYTLDGDLIKVFRI